MAGFRSQLQRQVKGTVGEHLPQRGMMAGQMLEKKKGFA
jgi:hypothetical protein